MSDEHKYEFGGKKFVQRPVVWGQMEELVDIIAKVPFKSIDGKLDAITLVKSLGEYLLPALAIVLIEEGVPLWERDMPSHLNFIRYNLPAETVLQVVEDFFVCNPTASFLERLAGMLNKVVENLPTEGEQTMEKFMRSLQTGTSPSETESNGDSPQVNLSLSSSIGGVSEK